MASLPPRRSVLRRARKLLGLALVGALAVSVLAASSSVVVAVDDREQVVQTYASTVGEVLDQAGVELAAADEVVPGRDAEVRPGMTVRVRRAVTVDVVVDDGRVEEVRAPVRTAGAAVVAAGLGDARALGAEVRPAWTTPVEDGDVIRVALPAPVRLTVAGHTRVVRTHAETVEELLDERRVEVGDDDILTPARDRPLGPGDEVVVARVAHEREVTEVALEHDEVRRETDELPEGETRVDTPGADGLRRDHYRVELVDGEPADRELVEREIVREPTDRVVLVGTGRPPEPAAPEPSTPAPEPAPAPATGDGVWDRLAECESGGNWSHRGGAYHGGLQFHPDTWSASKPAGYPDYAYQASREQQIVVGKRVKAAQGWAAWPECSRRIGVR